MPKFKKYEIQDLYEKILLLLEGAMGSGTTMSGPLDQVGRALFLTKWKGVFASNEQYPDRGYCIVNLDPSYESGSHWVAVANGLVYDSFGRCGLLDDSRLKCGGDKLPDQDQLENNCGQRCLAWLCVHQVAGVPGANMV
jgi:hypothetical protein